MKSIQELWAPSVLFWTKNKSKNRFSQNIFAFDSIQNQMNIRKYEYPVDLELPVTWKSSICWQGPLKKQKN